jgi:hypothetical protein
MDMGPAHKNIAINHIVARGSRIPDSPNPAFKHSVYGDENDNPSACVRALKAARPITPEPITPVPVTTAATPEPEATPTPAPQRLMLPLYTTPEQRAQHIVGAGMILDAIAEARASGCALPQLP